jgi:hypothetical protein
MQSKAAKVLSNLKPAQSSETKSAAAKKFAKATPKITVESLPTAEKPFDLKKFSVPKSLAQVADLAYELRERRYAIQNSTKDIEKAEKMLKDYLILNLPKSDASGVAGKTARAKIETKTIPQIEDNKKFLAYVKKTGEFDLITSSMNSAAVEARWEKKKKVPGVGTFTVTKVSLTKV